MGFDSVEKAVQYLNEQYFNDYVMDKFGSSVRQAETDDDYADDELARTIVKTIRDGVKDRTPDEQEMLYKFADDLFSAITGWGIDMLVSHVKRNVEWK